LSLASENDKPETVRVLLLAGADPNIPPGKNSPLYKAKNGEYSDEINTLILNAEKSKASKPICLAFKQENKATKQIIDDETSVKTKSDPERKISNSKFKL
jgi:hypothetical protein